jgi:hypothetical protein
MSLLYCITYAEVNNFGNLLEGGYQVGRRGGHFGRIYSVLWTVFGEGGASDVGGDFWNKRIRAGYDSDFIDPKETRWLGVAAPRQVKCFLVWWE